MYTCDDLVADVKRIGQIQTADGSLSDADLLSFGDQEISEDVMPALMSTAGEWFLRYQDIPFVSGDTPYRIPTRSAMNVIREVQTVDAQGNMQNILRITPNRLDQGNTGFYLRGADVILVGQQPSGVVSLRMWFYQRPGRMVLQAQSCKVTAVNSTTYSTTSTPAAWRSVAPGMLDFVRGASPFDCLAPDVNATAVAGANTVTPVAMASPAPLVGDWISLSGETPVVPLPPEWHRYLATRIAARVQASQGFMEAAGALMQAAEASRVKLSRAMIERVRGEPERIQRRTTLFRGVRR